jgi:hypothetical protein
VRDDLVIDVLPCIEIVFRVLQIWWVVMRAIPVVCVGSLRGLMLMAWGLFIILVLLGGVSCLGLRDERVVLRVSDGSARGVVIEAG